jgi:hypothetical protein
MKGLDKRNRKLEGGGDPSISRASETTAVLIPMPDIDQLMTALLLLAVLFCLVPAVFGLGKGQRWFQRGATVTLGTAIAIAVAASLIWTTRWRLNI